MPSRRHVEEDWMPRLASTSKQAVRRQAQMSSKIKTISSPRQFPRIRRKGSLSVYLSKPATPERGCHDRDHVVCSQGMRKDFLPLVTEDKDERHQSLSAKATGGFLKTASVHQFRSDHSISSRYPSKAKPEACVRCCIGPVQNSDRSAMIPKFKR